MYEKMYFELFNAVSDAIEHLETMQAGKAVLILKEAQKRTEEIYIEESEK